MYYLRAQFDKIISKNKMKADILVDILVADIVVSNFKKRPLESIQYLLAKFAGVLCVTNSYLK